MKEPGIITEIKQNHINKKNKEYLMDKQLSVVNGYIAQTVGDFNKLAEVHGAVDFEAEASYAIQVMKNNDFLVKIAMNNPDSLKYAVLNVASIGLTLNPVSKYAYLVPRKGAVCLDISYMGLVQLACESGAMKWIQSQLVYKNDHYQFVGVGQKPEHRFNSFAERGPIVGVYCVAKTEDGEYLVEQMSIEECYSIRDRSEAWKRNQSGPWKTDEGEMIKKTVIKRAFKLWPKNDKTERLNIAVDTTNQAEGIDFAAEVHPPITESQINMIIELVDILDKEFNKDFFDYVSRVCKRDVVILEDLDAKEANTLLTQLEQFAKAAPPKKEETKDEPIEANFTAEDIKL